MPIALFRRTVPSMAMKIIHYMNHARMGNGHVGVAVDLSCEQARAGHDVYFVSGHSDFDELLKRNGVRVVTLGEVDGPLRLPIMAWRFLGVVRRVRPDVVNAHMVWAALSAKIARTFVRFGLVTTIHNSFDPQARLMGVGDRVVAVSDAVGHDLQKRGIAADKLRTVTNGTVGGVRRPPFNGKAENLLHPAVVTVCGMHSRKGVAHLIDAFASARAHVPDAQLYLVGGGPEQQDFEERARLSGSGDNIHFMGFRDDPREILASADLFVLASLRDPCPLVICEAREMGNAIIASAVDGIPAALSYGHRGVLVRPADPAALSREIVRLLVDDNLRRKFSQAAQEDLDGISVRRVSEETIKVYAETLVIRPRSHRSRNSPDAIRAFSDT